MLPLENLTGNSSLDWIQTTAPEILGAELSGSPNELARPVAAIRDAYLERATDILHGYFEQRGALLHFEVSVEDAVTHKLVQTFAADGAPVDAMNQSARTIDPAARPFPTSNPQAIEAWGHGDFERALTLDPDFGPAWLEWVRKLIATGDRPQALEIAMRALGRTSLQSPINRDEIELVKASLDADQGEEKTALENMARLRPSDPTSCAALAALAMESRDFSSAAEWYRRVNDRDPSAPTTANLLGYALAFGGDLRGATASLENYRHEPGQEANALDSLGEVNFLHGNFTVAEKFFLQAHARSATLLGGGDLRKAAYSTWLSGDLKGADQIERRYIDFRSAHGDTQVVWREATWLYATGRIPQATALLARSHTPQADAQLKIWNGTVTAGPLAPLFAGRYDEAIPVLKQIYEHTQPAEDGEIRTLYAWALVGSGRREEARPLLALWPLPEVGPDPFLYAMEYPQFLQLRRTLGIK